MKNGYDNVHKNILQTLKCVCYHSSAMCTITQTTGGHTDSIVCLEVVSVAHGMGLKNPQGKLIGRRCSELMSNLHMSAENLSVHIS